MRSEFIGQLDQLHQALIRMGGLCETVIGQAVQALTAGDPALAAKAAATDPEIDQLERDIEALCMKLLLKQQPVSGDLRQISAALKMITDMERIGDQARDIAEIITFLGGRTGEECAAIDQMGKAAIRMVRESVEAYVAGDLELARQVIDYDDVVDEGFDRVKTALISWIAQKPQDGEYALDLLMIAKYLERIGDHATNLAEWVEYAITGARSKNGAPFVFESEKL